MLSERDGSPAIDQVEAALHAISGDSCALDRLAVVSTLRLNGETAWVYGLAYQLTESGRDVRLEVAVYPDPRQKAEGRSGGSRRSI